MVACTITKKYRMRRDTNNMAPEMVPYNGRMVDPKSILLDNTLG